MRVAKFDLDHRPVNKQQHRPVRQHFSKKKIGARASPIAATLPEKATP
jgi:hypothetical protein